MTKKTEVTSVSLDTSILKELNENDYGSINDQINIIIRNSQYIPEKALPKKNKKAQTLALTRENVDKINRIRKEYNYNFSKLLNEIIKDSLENQISY
jgi:hypothetical protein